VEVEVEVEERRGERKIIKSMNQSQRFRVGIEAAVGTWVDGVNGRNECNRRILGVDLFPKYLSTCQVSYTGWIVSHRTASFVFFFVPVPSFLFV
jgi:hypothetical protein